MMPGTGSGIRTPHHVAGALGVAGRRRLTCGKRLRPSSKPCDATAVTPMLLPGGLPNLNRPHAGPQNHRRLGSVATTTLLLVEDDDFVRSALTRALNRTGVFTVAPAEHGARALELFEQ